MSSRSEVGHAKNVALFSFLVVHCEGLGAAYNPANPAITLPALQAALAAANQGLLQARDARFGYTNATNTRQIAFHGLSTFAARVLGSLRASGATPQTMDDAAHILRKLRGQRAPGGSSEPAATEPATPAQPGTQPSQVANAQPQPETSAVARRISASQRSYDLRADHFTGLVQLLATQPMYTPNEADLNLSALQAKQGTLAAANLLVQQTITAYENANIQRNVLLYAPTTGIVSLAVDVKAYIKSLYGPSTEQYRTVSRIQFRGRA